MAKLTKYTVTPSNGVIPVCFSGNRKIFHGIVLCVLSILKHTQRPVTVYILTMDLSHLDPRFTSITEGQCAALDKIVKSYNAENSVVRIDHTKEFQEEFAKSKNVKTGFTPYTISRLLLDKFPVPDKTLYIDVDTMLCSDIAQLYDVDMDGWEFAAALDVVGCHWVRPTYCNAGVLLLNIAEMKKTGLFVKARRRVNKVKMFMPDQSALNFLVKRKMILPAKFNEQRTIKPDTVIKHFCQGFKWYGPFFKLYNYKQWDRENVHEKLNIHDFDDLYALYDDFDEKYDFNNA